MKNKISLTLAMAALVAATNFIVPTKVSAAPAMANEKGEGTAVWQEPMGESAFMWDPFFDIARWHDRMERFMARNFGTANGDLMNAGFSPALDAEETPAEYRLQVDLPGMEKNEISLEVQGDVLSISGERKSEKQEEDKSGLRRYERSFGAFTRSVKLPENVAVDQISAEYEKGVLTVHIPKLQPTEAEPAPSRSIAIR